MKFLKFAKSSIKNRSRLLQWCFCLVWELVRLALFSGFLRIHSQELAKSTPYFLIFLGDLKK